MKAYTRNEFDHRDAAQMYDYLEASIQALRARIGELKNKNETLRSIQRRTQAERDRDAWERYLDKITGPPPLPYKQESMESLHKSGPQTVAARGKGSSKGRKL